jgi:hypothetical protein
VDESGRQFQFVRELLRMTNRDFGKINSCNDRSSSDPTQRVGTNVALQVKQLSTDNIADLSQLRFI